MRILKVHLWPWPSCWQDAVRDRALVCILSPSPRVWRCRRRAGPCAWCSPAGLQTQPLIFQDYSLDCLESLLFLALPSLGCWGYSHSPPHSVLLIVNSEANHASTMMIQTPDPDHFSQPHLFTPQLDCHSLLFCLTVLSLLQPSE